MEDGKTSSRKHAQLRKETRTLWRHRHLPAGRESVFVKNRRHRQDFAVQNNPAGAGADGVIAGQLSRPTFSLIRMSHQVNQLH